MPMPRRADIPVRIADGIRAHIANGVYPPESRLSQTALAEEFNASRVPIREALKLLSSESIVEHDPNRGFFVAPVSLDEARQLFRLRELVETLLLETLERPGEEQLAALQAQAERMEALLRAGDRNAWWPQHRAFHQIVFDLSPKKRLVAEAMRLWTLTDRYRALLPTPVRDEDAASGSVKHELVEALRCSDPATLLETRHRRRGQFEAAIEQTMTALGMD